MVEDRRDEHARVGATVRVEVVVAERARRVAVVEQHELEPLPVRIVDDLPHILTPLTRATSRSWTRNARVIASTAASMRADSVGRPVHDAQ